MEQSKIDHWGVLDENIDTGIARSAQKFSVPMTLPVFFPILKNFSIVSNQIDVWCIEYVL